MVYTITSFLHSSPTGSLSPVAPLVQRSSRSCFIVWSALDPARLPPPIASLAHPMVELIEPASVAYPHAGVCSCSSPVSKAVGQGA